MNFATDSAKQQIVKFTFYGRRKLASCELQLKTPEFQSFAKPGESESCCKSGALFKPKLPNSAYSKREIRLQFGAV